MIDTRIDVIALTRRGCDGPSETTDRRNDEFFHVCDSMILDTCMAWMGLVIGDK